MGLCCGPAMKVVAQATGKLSPHERIGAFRSARPGWNSLDHQGSPPKPASLRQFVKTDRPIGSTWNIEGSAASAAESRTQRWR